MPFKVRYNTTLNLPSEVTNSSSLIQGASVESSANHLQDEMMKRIEEAQMIWVLAPAIMVSEK
jgi:hypothetical protein